MAQRIIDRSRVGEVLQHLYENDLNIQISLVSNGGYFYADTGKKRTPLRGTTLEEAVTHLATRTAEEFPRSEFAIWWTNSFRDERN